MDFSQWRSLLFGTRSLGSELTFTVRDGSVLAKILALLCLFAVGVVWALFWWLRFMTRM